jgi:CBS domain-containing protein
MRVGDICSRNPSYVTRDVRVLEAARRMRTDHVGDLIVVEERHGRPFPIGVLTDRDVVVGVLAHDPKHDPARSGLLDVGDVIDGTLVSATEDEDLAPVLRRMRSFGVRRVPIVDAEGCLVGVLSVDDVIPAISDELAEIGALVSRQADWEKTSRQ